MIIHSRFKDYYDTATSYGVDTTVHWKRDNWLESSDSDDFKAQLPDSLWVDANMDDYIWKSSHPMSRKHSTSDHFQSGIIGFCGKLYPFIHSQYEDGVDGFGDTIWKTDEVFYSWDKWDAFRNQFKQRDVRRRYRRWYRGNRTKSVFENAPYAHDALFLELDTPVFLAIYGHRDYKVWKDPILKDWEFFKVKDPVTAFQEIQMYLTNQLVKEKEVLEIADKYRIAGHGYDKHSFRHPVKF